MVNTKIKGFCLVILFCLISINSFAEQRQTLAILTLENLTNDHKEDWLGVGFAETLTTKLNKVRELQLIERIQIEKLLKEIGLGMSGIVDEDTAQRAGKILGVNYILIGSYQKMNEEYIVNTRIVKVETGEVILSEEAQGKNIFELQTILALKIAKSFGLNLTTEEEMSIKSKPAENTVAFKYFSQGVEYYYKSEYKKAKEEFEKSLIADPDYSDAKLWVETATNMQIAMRKIPNWRIGVMYMPVQFKMKAGLDPDYNLEDFISISGILNSFSIYYEQKFFKYSSFNFEYIQASNVFKNNSPSSTYDSMDVSFNYKAYGISAKKYFIIKNEKFSPFPYLSFGIDYYKIKSSWFDGISNHNAVDYETIPFLTAGIQILQHTNLSLDLGLRYSYLMNSEIIFKGGYYDQKGQIDFNNPSFYGGLKFNF